jgi:hypothetical protein
MVGNGVLAAAVSSCSSYTDDCYHILTCPEPAYCFDAGDAQLDGCPNLDTHGGNDAQND